MSVGQSSLTMLFQFDELDRIRSVHAALRGAMTGKETVTVPWEGRWTDYQSKDGMMILMEGEATWLWPSGRRPYFRGKVTSLICEYAP